MRRRFKPRPKKQVEVKYRVNEQIRVPVVFLISEDGEQLGEMPNFKALEMAKSKGMDLVEVAPNARPPVCKIADYGKLQYAQSKQNRLQKARQKKSEIKGIRIGMKTDTHDVEFKTKQADKFLAKGDKVKIEIRMKGREKAYQDLARKNLHNFVSQISTPFKIEEDIKRFPGGFNIIIAPE